jgi:hypothetical protein
MRTTMTATALLTLTIALAHAQEPTTTSAPAATQPASSLEIIPRDAWGSRPNPIPASRKQTPKFFTLHHAGDTWKAGTDPADSLRRVQAWGQREKGWPDLPYHYIIAPDGRVFEGRDWQYQPESNTKYDLNGVLNIELLGNFEVQRVSPEQLRATVALVAKLSKDLNVSPDTIRGHRDAAEGQTVCPGKDFYRYVKDGLIKRWVVETLEGKSADVRELEPLADGPTTRISTEAPPTEPAN